MLQTMCIIGCELVCVPCQTWIWVCNTYEEMYSSSFEHRVLTSLCQKGIHKLAFERGGATCCDCDKSGGNNCPTCNIDYDYKFKPIKQEGKWLT